MKIEKVNENFTSVTKEKINKKKKEEAVPEEEHRPVTPRDPFKEFRESITYVTSPNPFIR